jgi:hypothetical protein
MLFPGEALLQKSRGRTVTVSHRSGTDRQGTDKSTVFTKLVFTIYILYRILSSDIAAVVYTVLLFFFIVTITFTLFILQPLFALSTVLYTVSLALQYSLNTFVIRQHPFRAIVGLFKIFRHSGLLAKKVRNVIFNASTGTTLFL